MGFKAFKWVSESTDGHWTRGTFSTSNKFDEDPFYEKEQVGKAYDMLDDHGYTDLCINFNKNDLLRKKQHASLTRLKGNRVKHYCSRRPSSQILIVS